jgi:hypothetical protein
MYIAGFSGDEYRKGYSILVILIRYECRIPVDSLIHLPDNQMTRTDDKPFCRKRKDDPAVESIPPVSANLGAVLCHWTDNW